MRKTIITLALILSGCTVTVPAQITGGTVPVTKQEANAPTQTPKVVSAVRITPDSVVLPTGNSQTITGNIAYTDGSFDSSLTWASSDTSILAINPTTGVMSGLRDGVATVIAVSTLDPSKKAQATVTVRPADVVAAVTTIAPNKASVPVGDTVQLQATVKLSNGSVSPNVVWSSSNQSTALVTNGLVTGLAPGTVTITATAVGDPTKRAVATITVIEQ